eukprot:4595775-Pleurochrysis_carterae.AAC.1
MDSLVQLALTVRACLTQLLPWLDHSAALSARNIEAWLVRDHNYRTAVSERNASKFDRCCDGRDPCGNDRYGLDYSCARAQHACSGLRARVGPSMGACDALQAMERYQLLHLVGEGSFGKVYKGRRTFCGQVAAAAEI